MKLVAELCILVIFFLAYYFEGMYVAIGVAMVLYTAQLLVMFYLRKPITKLELLTYFSVVVLGGMSLVFQNELFFKWKPSVIYVLFAAAIVITRTWTKSSAMQKLLGHAVQLPARIWSQLDYLWCGFFLSVAGLNLLVAYTFSTDTWVYFKLFGMMSLLLLFLVLQGLWLASHLKSGGTK